MELVNATRKTIDTGAGPADPAVREAAETIAVVLNLFAPYTAEEMWEMLGYEPSVALAPWRKPDPTLLVEESVTAVVQVDGKVRARLEVSPKIGDDELEALARADEPVQRALGRRREIVQRDRARPEDRQHRRQGLTRKRTAAAALPPPQGTDPGGSCAPDAQPATPRGGLPA